jgi:hypothetical protein
MMIFDIISATMTSITGFPEHVDENYRVPMQVLVREWVLGESFVLTLCMLVIFLANIVVYARRKPEGGIWHLYWAQSDWMRAAIALTTFLAGISMRAMWVWALLWKWTHGHHVETIEKLWFIDVIAGLLTIIGGVLVVREFTPSEWSDWPLWRRPWFAALYLTIIFMVGAHIV